MQGHVSVPLFKLKAVLPAQENSHITKRLLIWVLFLKWVSLKTQHRSLVSILLLYLVWMQHQEAIKAGFGCDCKPASFTWMAQQVVPLSGSVCELHARGGISLITTHVTDNQVVDAWSHAPKVLVSQPAESGTCPKCTMMPVPCCGSATSSAAGPWPMEVLPCPLFRCSLNTHWLSGHCLYQCRMRGTSREDFSPGIIISCPRTEWITFSPLALL